jgi:hypothetical protein
MGTKLVMPHLHARLIQLIQLAPILRGLRLAWLGRHNTECMYCLSDYRSLKVDDDLELERLQSSRSGVFQV